MESSYNRIVYNSIEKSGSGENEVSNGNQADEKITQTGILQEEKVDLRPKEFLKNIERKS
jgi:hypothetical protein